MVKFKIKYLYWFFQMLWQCLIDLFRSPMVCYKENLLKENWKDLFVMIDLDDDKDIIELVKNIKKNTEMKTKLAIFDFDGTLINTALPETGKVEYEKKTGKPWPHKGWWGQADSLDTSVFDMPVIDSVIADYENEKRNPNTLMVLLTGRRSKLAPNVKKVLDENGLSFDEYHYNTGGNTDVFKLKTLDDLVQKHQNVEIEMWEDDYEKLLKYEAWGKEQCLSGRLKDFRINFIISGHH